MDQHIFLSHFIDKTTPLYGGAQTIVIEGDSRIGNGGSANTKRLAFPNHSGTHIDFPLHFSNNGKSLNAYTPEFWIFNRPFLITYPVADNEIISLPDLIELIPTTTDFLMVKTGFQKHRNTEKYWKYNPGFDPELALKLRERCPSLKACGFDSISLSGYQNRAIGREAHKSFLNVSDILIIEDMDLSKVPATLKRVFCFPLMIDFADGSPVTIIAEINE